MNIGIIGVGVIAVGNHIPAYRELGHSVVALADNAPGRAEKFARQLSVPDFYEDYNVLLARDDIDAVSVCVPTFLHEQVAVDALRAGKHVYLEKPPALDEAGIFNIYNTAQETKRTLLVGSNSIYHPQYKIAKDIVDSGRLGNVYVVKVNRAQRRDIPNGWMTKKKYTRGFAIMEGVTHNLDGSLYLLGEPRPLAVTCVTYNMFANYKPLRYGYPMDAVESGQWSGEPKETEDAVLAMVSLEGGCTIMVEAFRACNAEKMYNVKLYGDKAGMLIDHKRIYWDQKEGGLTLYEEVQHGVLTESELDFTNRKWSHTDAIGHFLDCIKTGEQTISNGKRAVSIMKIVDGMFESAEQGGRQVMLK
ncbi:MAG: Gfo/Idh/MocA family oxidoreductase [Oscillospiraceae bacterium]|jgi:predicted dehydrogenase|nr:Gfo/Idh/MocA family oxidoreductase [Oscillospiraceae bacterium]